MQSRRPRPECAAAPRRWGSGRRHRVWGLCVASVLAAACARGPAPPSGPALVAGAGRGKNVRLVTIDTLRRDRIGAYGHSGGATPTLDPLSAAGVRIAHAFSHVPLTLPAHASILTGRTPPGHGLHVNGASALSDDVPTMATVLDAAGLLLGVRGRLRARCAVRARSRLRPERRSLSSGPERDVVRLRGAAWRRRRAGRWRLDSGIRGCVPVVRLGAPVRSARAVRRPAGLRHGRPSRYTRLDGWAGTGPAHRGGAGFGRKIRMCGFTTA